MQKKTIINLVLMLVCAVGGLLIGFNAGQLSSNLNPALFVVGIGLVSVSLTLSGIMAAIIEKKARKEK